MTRVWIVATLLAACVDTPPPSNDTLYSVKVQKPSAPAGEIVEPEGERPVKKPPQVGASGETGESGQTGTPLSTEPSVVALGDPDRILLRGTVIAGEEVLREGEVLVEGELITCVATTCSADGATIIDTGGVILPGLIDAHNHILYDVFDETDWTPPKLYTNRNQWGSDAGYVAMKQRYDEAESTVACEMNKYGELKSLLAGTTSVISLAGERKCFQSFARTIDTRFNDLPADKMKTFTLPISGIDATEAQQLKDEFANDVIDAWVIHLAEGIDDVAKNEWTKLVSLGLDVQETTIIHGTALGPDEFAAMAAKGMELVWSPKSNVVLYGKTTDIPAARAAGVRVALAPDWSISGSVNLLDELRYANAIDDAEWSDALSPRDLYEMVTENAAKALAIDQYVGTLAPGKYADILVIAGDREKPYDALLAADTGAVRLTMVSGRTLYGDERLIDASNVADCIAASACDAGKFLCVSEPAATDKLNQSTSDITQALATKITGSLPPAYTCTNGNPAQQF